MSLETNLIAAFNALRYVQNTMAWGGASNKPEDIEASKSVPRDWDGFKAPTLTGRSVGKLRDETKKLRDQAGGMGQVMIMAEAAETRMIGNCAEQSSIACKFLLNDPSVDKFCLAGLGINHEFVVIGAEPKQIMGMYSVSAPPGWPPEAVICDPWYGLAYGVRTGWTTHIPLTLAKTEPNFPRTHVDVVPRRSHIWNYNPLHKKE